MKFINRRSVCVSRVKCPNENVDFKANFVYLNVTVSPRKTIIRFVDIN